MTEISMEGMALYCYGLAIFSYIPRAHAGLHISTHGKIAAYGKANVRQITFHFKQKKTLCANRKVAVCMPKRLLT